MTQDSDFLPFLKAINSSPTCKIKIKITMEDPNKARNMKKEKSQADGLTLSYGPEKDQLAFERKQAQLAANVVANITARILDVYDSTTKLMQVKDPDNPNRSIWVNFQNLLPYATNKCYTPTWVSSSGGIMPPLLPTHLVKNHDNNDSTVNRTPPPLLDEEDLDPNDAEPGGLPQLV
ncbi:hypothetical protein VP01_2806g3 [Puccinia sorghi]|uniref:Uncharacterized protein n=1 Tax=Puccinia sorghi TaxID=27349 RepID=A0A0L6V378_9BASI|nr:hypothetical protein VP01_2806g3 [Puccinia sorghi]